MPDQTCSSPGDHNAGREHGQPLCRCMENPVVVLDEYGDGHLRSVARDGAAALTRDFYQCPNTGEWVYKWCDERLALKADDVTAAWERRVAELEDRLALHEGGGIA